MKYIWIICIMILTQQASAQGSTAIKGSWKITGIGIDSDGDGMAETNTWKACNEGSTLSFNEDGTGSYYKGNKPCNVNAVNPLPFTWQIDKQDNVSIKMGAKQETLKIVFKSQTLATVYFTSAKVLYTVSK